MWKESAKWTEQIKRGGHAIVRFDSFCGACGRQIAEDITADEIRDFGLHSDSPMEVFCGSDCANKFEHTSGKKLLLYGWRCLFTR